MAELEERITRFVEYLREHPVSTSNEVAASLGISPRTVRNYVHGANRLLGETARIDSERGAWRLVVLDERGLDALVERGMAQTLAVQEVPSTRDGRVSYLLNDLLARSTWVTLDDMAGVLFVTRRTLSEDLKDVERVLERFGLALERRPRYGIRVTGPEMARRLCLANIVLATVEPGISVRELSELVDTVTGCIDEALGQGGLEIHSVSYQNLVVHVAVAIIRIREQCYIPSDPVQSTQRGSNRAYGVAEILAHSLERELDVHLPSEEIGYIAIHLLGKQVIAREQMAVPSEEPDGCQRPENISDEVWSLVDSMLERVWTSMRFDLRHDLELKMNLALHIAPLVVRMRYRMSIGNPMLAQIKLRYPIAYLMASEAGLILEETVGALLSEEEIGYLALAFALALERLRERDASRRNILIVCASGQGTAQLLRLQYEQEFGSYLGHIYTCDAQHVSEQDFSRIDYVLTTVSLSADLPVPVREVGFFLDADDARDLRNALSGIGGPDGAEAAWFPYDLFFAHESFESKEEAIHVLCERSAPKGVDAAELERLVLEREDAGVTAFGGLAAMPHPAQAVCSRTVAAFCLLDRPLDWGGGRHVRLVILVLVARGRHGDDLQPFYAALSRLFLDDEAILELLANPTYGKLLDIVQPTSRNRSQS